ncbi:MULTISPECIES: hypothetical protein [unclassified Yoonia]|uniref:hypothetical protein n=1 Tax=unclassified Yoonia TaxID=2629118 RepID=UPI003729500D
MNLGDAIHETSMRHWTVTGGNRIVKVVSPTADLGLQQYGTAMGYVTQEKYLFGKNSREIEKLLGVRPNEFAVMCHVYALARVPTPDEVEFKFSTAFPDGKVFEAEQHDQMMTAREDFAAGTNLYDRSMTPVAQYYPPGSNMVPQWKLVKAVPLGGRIATVTPQFAYPRANGSIKPYTPHNRGEIK